MAADEALEPAAPRAEPDRAAGAWPAGVGSLGGALAGAVVGAADGLRAAAAHGGGHFVATAVLAAAVDALGGLAAGAAVELLARLAVWGRRARPGRGARAAAFVVTGAGAAAAAAAVVSATALRRNRFLAAGLTALAAAAVGLLGALLAPALARLLGGRRAAAVRPRVPGAGFLVGAPLAVLAAAAVIFAAVARTRAPLHGPALIERSAWSALAGVPAAGPAGLGGRPSELPAVGRRWAPLVGGLYAVLALVVGRIFWEDNLRFAPWTDLLVGAAVVAGGGRAGPRAARALAADGVARRWAGRRRRVWWLPWRCSARRRWKGRARRAARGRRWSARCCRSGKRCWTATATATRAPWAAVTATTATPTCIRARPTCPATGSTPIATARTPPSPCRRRRSMAPLPRGVPSDLNLLLVTIDTLRADHLGCYGYARPTSPAIDGLAAAGALFENGWAHAPSTRYSMPAIATGRWPSAITWDESILVAAHGPRHAHHRRSAARRRLFHGRHVQLQLFRNRRPPRVRARDGSLPIGPGRAARGGERADGVARLVVARDDRRRDRLRRRAQGPQVLPVAALLRPAPFVRAARGGAVVRQRAGRSLRRRDPLHRSALRAAPRAPARRRVSGTARPSW